MYAVYTEAEDALFALHLATEERNDYETIKTMFETHFVPRRNVIYETVKFDISKEDSHDSAEKYITELPSWLKRMIMGA